MSAWIVNREHIDLLVCYGARANMGQPGRSAASWVAQNPQETPWQEWEYRTMHPGQTVTISDDDLGTVDSVDVLDYAGRVLWTENVKSIEYRYPDVLDGGCHPGPCDFNPLEASGYEYRDPGYTLTPLEAIQACDCLDYQSCEHPGWRSSEAHRIMQAIRELAISSLEGERGPWGWDSENLRERRSVSA